jgi:hypothetical protein
MKIETRAIHLLEEAAKRKRINNFLQFLSDNGKTFTLVKNVTYHDGKTKIGIGTANERLPNQWLLVLPDDEYDTVALLCEKKDGTVFRFILAKQFFSEIKPKLPRDSNNRFQFSVGFERQSFHLNIHGYPSMCLDKFRDNISALI